MKAFTWQSYDGRPLLLCGPYARCVPFLKQIKKSYERFFNTPFTLTVRICDDEFAGQQEPYQVIGAVSLADYRNDYIILVGKTFYKSYLRALGFSGLSDFYSAVAVIDDGFLKQDYFMYFTSLYRRQKQGLYLGGVEIVLTKRCTLRCKYCSNLMQYYTGVQERLDHAVVIQSVRRLLAAVDGVAMFKILGGEPLMEQELLADILRLPEVALGGKILGIQLITNGTILFTESVLDALAKNPLAAVYLSNYGALSVHEEAIKKQLVDRAIPFSETCADALWYDYGKPDVVYKKNEAENLKFYNLCKSKENCCTVLDGTFYSCPRTAHGDAIGFYPHREDECVHLLNEDVDEGDASVSLRTRLKTFYYRTEPLQACQCCLSVCAQNVPKAEQLVREAEKTVAEKGPLL
ncbi:MAG: radical SAM protein [Treponema sp.]|nr:radical SAM protein [Treponema sp.]